MSYGVYFPPPNRLKRVFLMVSIPLVVLAGPVFIAVMVAGLISARDALGLWGFAAACASCVTVGLGLASLLDSRKRKCQGRGF
jgi:hypothetical protein